jgi:hypothetical protein
MPTYVPPQIKVAYHNDIVVKNVLFSTMEHVAQLWPEAIE